jgi:AraC-like DNA-binding protein
MVNQINIFLLLFGALQGWLLSLWFFRNRPKGFSNVCMAALLVVVSLQLTSKVISKIWLMDHVIVFYLLSYRLPYLVGPLIYLYARSRTDNNHKPAASLLLHFIPFLCAVAVATLAREFGFGYPHPYAEALLQFVSLTAYCFLANKIALPGLRGFIRIVWAAEIIIIVTLALMVMFYGSFPNVRIGFVVLTLLIYWISYRAISAPQFLVTDFAIVQLNVEKNPKYAHSSLRAEEADRIEGLLRQMMEKEKLFLDSTITIDTLSTKLLTTRHNLSQVINERLKRTYTDYLNDFRLEEARERLGNPKNLRFTIAAIALDSGFNSVSSFNDLFKKRFGTTPLQYRQQHVSKMSA